MNHIKGLIVIMCLLCLFTSIGFAQLSDTLTIEGTVSVEEPEGIYIQSAVAADNSGVTVTQYVGNILTVNIQPGITNAEVVIRIKNNSPTDQYFLNAVCPENMTCATDSLPVGTKFESGGTVEFTAKISNTAAQETTAAIIFQFIEIPPALGDDENQEHTNATQVINFIINDPDAGLNSSNSLLLYNCTLDRPVVWCKENATQGGTLDGIYSNTATSHVVFMMEYSTENAYNIYILDLNVTGKEINADLTGQTVVVYKQEIVRIDNVWVASQSSKGYSKIAQFTPSKGKSVLAIETTSINNVPTSVVWNPGDPPSE